MPNNRQWALLIWIGIGLIGALTQPGLRRSLGAIVRSLLHPRLLWTIIGYLGVAVLAIWGADLIELWSSTLISDTVTWLFISGAALYATFVDVESEPDFFISHVRQIIGLSLIAEFVLEVGVLPFVVEFSLVPLFVLIGGLRALSGRDAKYTSMHGLVNGCLTLIVLSLLGFGLFTLITS